ncbi:MAG: hypothetical protein V2I46_01365 [Bacteroides sp.]|jgi:hypothetical protein|nr:hypothetical protein [Bacteroides sp.]
MKRIVFALTTLLIFSAQAFSQNENDAFRYSFMKPGGTARFTSMGGAFGALGGDFSSLSTNPAGLGIFRSSEITFTPTLDYSLVESSYYGTISDDMKYNFNLNNLGVVFSLPLSSPVEQPGWKAINFGFGINRHNNYNQRWTAEGFNTQSSLMTDFMNQANQEGSLSNLDDFSTGLAWDTWLLFEDNGQYGVDMPDGNVLQRQETNSSGSIREFIFSIGANYNDFLFLGATVGLPSVRYEENAIFQETDTENLSEAFNSLTYTNKFSTSGTGFNLKVGAILRPTDMVRLGIAVHTPTFFKLEDEYYASMESSLNLTDYTDYSRSPDAWFAYELNTPMKAIGSLGLVFGTAGLISIDYEYVDYSKMRLRSDDYLFADENRVIQENYTTQHNIRIGGEVRLDPLVLRGGYAFYSSPYQSGVNDGQQSVASAGLGFRDRSFFLDFGYALTFFSEDYYLYSAQFVNPVENKYTMSRFMLTFGFRF